MTRRGQWLLVAVILLVGLGAVGVTMYGVRDEIFPVDVGAKAPNFEAATLFDHKIRTLDDYKGQVVLINLWATWCAPCRIEMPSMQALYDEFGPKGLKIVAVNSADPDASDSIVTDFANGYGLTFDVLRDWPSRGRDSMKNIYKTTGFPESFVVDKSGIIRKKWSGADTWNSDGNRALIASLLGLPVPAPLPLKSPGDTALTSRKR
jgi:cytochrome c biogenesis protein CcmG, thiol:disulfide interchange protein DsbE